MFVMGLRRDFLVVGVCVLAACGDSPPGRTFFDRNIQPILSQKCVGNTSGCHSVNDGDVFQIAAGNLDVTSFENIQKRKDTLSPFGAYPFPLFLIKSVGPSTLKMQYGEKFVDIDVQHSGGAIIEVGSDAYFTLQNWLENGATENGLKSATPPQNGEGDCSIAIPSGFDRTKYITAMSMPRFSEFKTAVQPVLVSHGCTAGSCHGAPQSDFYITCGTTDEQLEFNFSQAWSFVNTPVDDSQLLRVPLAVARGGRGHSGGDQFAGDDNDADYKALRTWAEAVGKLDFAGTDPGKQFFAANVQPVLLRRGCGFQACHSPQASNDFKMRSGSIGFFSAVALEKNYELLRQEFMALEFPDARRGRAVAKTILEEDARIAGVGGIAHRGGPVLETSGGGMTGAADPAMCGVYNPLTATAFCTVQEWIRVERAALTGQVTPMTSGDPIEIVYIERSSPALAGRLEFDTFQGGANLLLASTTFGAGGSITPTGAGVSLLAGCGLGGNPDVQAPDVANDGNRIAFAARASAADPLGIYIVDVNGGNCTRITPAAPDSNGIKVHNFDPAWSPDGTHLVFASTRGKAGATKSRKRMLPQSDLWRVQVTGFTANASTLEQMTYLSNSEIGPQFMREGRVTMTTEKVSAGFYQLSGRRINWDLTDYHPLLGQRKDSPFADPADPAMTRPSIGYGAVTDIREGSDGDFLIILSDTNAMTGAPNTPAAAGALALFNRSIGPFEVTRANEVGYLPSVRVLDAAQAYRSPVSLPDGTIMVSHSATPATGGFNVISFNPRTGAKTTLITGGGSKLDAQLVYKFPARKLYTNRRQLVFGGRADPSTPDSAVLHMPDAPMLFTLLTANLRRGRPVDAFRGATSLAILTEDPCPANCAPNANGIYENRRELGSVSLAADGSARVVLPSKTGVILQLRKGGNVVATMTEEHQLGPGESVSMGVSENLFDAVCGGCHGSVSGSELDVRVTPDVLTGASRSLSTSAIAPN